MKSTAFTSLSVLAIHHATKVSGQDGAACGAACDSYELELKTVQPLNENVFTIGGQMTQNVVNYVCKLEFNNINTCTHCTLLNIGGYTDPEATNLVYAWAATCQTFTHKGVEQAVLCWDALPNDTSQCWAAPNASSSSDLPASSTINPSISTTSTANAAGSTTPASGGGGSSTGSNTRSSMAAPPVTAVSTLAGVFLLALAKWFL